MKTDFTLDYNKENFEIIKGLILENLSADLLPKKWVSKNQHNLMFGHCHTSSGCLQKVFGSNNITMYRGLDDENLYHWWVVDKDGTLIDLTADQYTSKGRIPPYDVGEKSQMLGFSYKLRVKELYERVASAYNNKRTVLDFLDNETE